MRAVCLYGCYNLGLDTAGYAVACTHRDPVLAGPTRLMVTVDTLFSLPH
jgi:hypothetical protein